MKRRQSAPLFQQIEPDVYVIDTSAWCNIDKQSDVEDSWRLIAGLIEEGRVVACAAVLDEMQDEDFYLTRIFPYEAALRAGDRNDTEYLLHVGKVTRQHPAMAGATGTKNKADPYVVALAELEGYVIVADETCKKRPNRKIPGVCQQRGIRFKLLDEFLAEVRAKTII
ncbi:MAG TPA: DUF4411 family protein [Terracidiphilus sp.]|jgi:pentatricopeptide repeat protein